MLERACRRAMHRLSSGLSFGKGEVRFLTLTSSPSSRRPIRYSFKLMVRYLKRRGVNLQYYAVVEQTIKGLDHLHILFRGPFLYQWCLSNLWRHFHHASIVWITKVRNPGRKLRGYLTKYMLKATRDDVGTSSLSAAYDSGAVDAPVYEPKDFRKLWACSRDWCYRRMSEVWKSAVAVFHRTLTRCDYVVLYGLWEMHLRGTSTPAQFLRWCVEVNGLAPFPPYRALVASIRGNEGYFESRRANGYE